MTLAKISLMEAYIIETLRSTGVTEEELLRVNDTSVQAWSKAHENFDFTLLQSLANNEETYESIIKEGYKIKYVTYNGLVNMLRLKFDKIPEKDFEKHEEYIGGLLLEKNERTELEQILSPNWTIVPADDGTISIRTSVQ